MHQLLVISSVCRCRLAVCSNEAPPCLVLPLHKIEMSIDTGYSKGRFNGDTMQLLSQDMPAIVHIRATADGEDCISRYFPQSAVHLPFCVICLRRLKNLNKITNGVENSSRIQISRSYAGSSSVELTGDAMASATSGVTTIRCRVCYLYEATMLRKHSLASSPLSSENDTNEDLSRISVDMEAGSQKVGVSDISSKAITSAVADRRDFLSNTGGIVSSTDIHGVTHQWSTRCKACGLSNNIWICLTCGYTGCGRYCKQHAEQHYVEHTRGFHHLSLELASGRIWNYRCDTVRSLLHWPWYSCCWGLPMKFLCIARVFVFTIAAVTC
jgi:hypothetical protein